MKPAMLDHESLETILQVMADAGMARAADGLSGMIGQNVTVSVPAVTVIPINAVAERVGGAGTPVVGIYLACRGDMGGHVMLILEYADALRLADLLLSQPEGLTTELDELSRSALAEAGNLTASFFLNAVAAVLGISSRPSPPAVIVDMAGAILDIMLITAGELADEVLLLEAVFRDVSRQLKLYFWVLPDLAPLRQLTDTRSQ